MVKNCYTIQKHHQQLNYGEQSLKEPYLIAVVFLKTVNLTTAWQLGTELFTKLKAGSMIITTMNKCAVSLIWNLIMSLNLKKMPRSISKIRQKKGQHYYQLCSIGCSVGIMVKAKYVSMECCRCLKTQNKLYWFSSGGHSEWDDHFYCKECFRRLFKMLPEKVKLTFYGYKGKDKKDVS